MLVEVSRWKALSGDIALLGVLQLDLGLVVEAPEEGRGTSTHDDGPPLNSTLAVPASDYWPSLLLRFYYFRLWLGSLS